MYLCKWLSLPPDPIPPPLPTGGRGRSTNSWNGPQSDGGILSQDSVFSFQPGPNVSPPPLPARPDSSDEDDPDYAYIDEKEVKGPGKGGRRPPSPSVDDQLKEIERDMRREKKAKKREEERMKSHTLLPGMPASRDRSPVSFGPKMDFAPAEPSDYLDFVPLKPLQTGQSLTQPPDGGYEVPMNIRGARRTVSESDSGPLSQPVQTFSGIGLSKDYSSTREDLLSRVSPARGGLENAPTLPPRTWRNDSTTSVNSALSSASGSHRRSTGAMDDSEPPAVFPSRNYRSSTSSDDPTSPRTRDSLHESTIPEEPSDATTGEANHTPRLSVSPEKELSHSHSPSPPPLPPRSPMKTRVSRQSSSSSGTSPRCPRCRNKSIHRHRVGMTTSLNDQHPPLASRFHRDPSNKGSLPDLYKTELVPDSGSEKSRQRHSSGSPTNSDYVDTLPVGVSAATFGYLQLQQQQGGEESVPISPPSQFNSELQSQMDMLNSLTETLDLDRKQQDLGKPQRQAARDRNSREEQKKSVKLDFEEALRLAQQVQADLSQPAQLPLTSKDARKVHVPNGHTPASRAVPPPLMKHKTIATLPLSPTTSSPHVHRNGNVTQRLFSPPASTSPPVPPRSLVSLGVPDQPSSRVGKSATLGSYHPPHVPPTHSSATTRPGFHWAHNRAPEAESSTVFIHHIRRSATKL